MSVAKTEATVEKSDLVSVFIDGAEVQVPKGTLAIRAAELIGVAIPRFCDHPLLDPMGACRQCLVEVPDAGNGRGFPKPQAACTLEVAPGMKISTQVTSPVAKKAQEGVMELLLINHPLDCPICDKGGECPLQNQAVANGRKDSRYADGVKRTFPKPVPISSQILLDRERCVLCARCTRFSEQIAGDPFIALTERGALQQVGMYAEHPYDSYFSGNVVQICPVGALTSLDYRFQSRPFDLVSTLTTCELCASGCQLRTDQRHFQVKRRLAGDLPEVNEEWNCDRGRFAFVSGRQGDRVTTPLVRTDGELRPASWPEAIDHAVRGLHAAGAAVGVLPGGRLTLESAYGYAKFARAVLGTNNIDHRSRPSSTEELGFLGAHVAGRSLGAGVTYADLEAAKRVVLVAFEPEEESPIVFLRLRKAVRKKGLQVSAVASWLSPGNAKLSATLVPTPPGAEASAVAGLTLDADTIILVGERAATAPGTLSAVVAAADRSGAGLAWIPRRAGELGAIDAGCLPTLLPGGRPVSDASARADLGAAWGVETLPADAGLDADGIVAGLASGKVKALVAGGIQPTDFADASAVRAGVEAADFVISLESRFSEISERADVVFPVVLIEEQAGTFVNWEQRRGRVNRVVKDNRTAMTDLRVLAALADALGADLGVRLPSKALAEFDELGAWEGPRPTTVAGKAAKPGPGLVLASWRQLIDGSASNDGSTALLATAHPSVLRVSAATASAAGLVAGEDATLTAPRGSVTLPVVVEPTMVAGTVWLPGNFLTGSIGELAVAPGDSVTLTRGGAA